VSAEMELVNQQEHRPALRDEVVSSHGPDLQRETDATRNSEKQVRLPGLGPFVMAQETVSLRPDQNGSSFLGCLRHEALSIVAVSGVRSVGCPLCRARTPSSNMPGRTWGT